MRTVYFLAINRGPSNGATTGMYLGLPPHRLISFLCVVRFEDLKLGCQVTVDIAKVAVGVTKTFCRALGIAQLLLQLQHLLQQDREASRYRLSIGMKETKCCFVIRLFRLCNRPNRVPSTPGNPKLCNASFGATHLLDLRLALFGNLLEVRHLSVA